MCELCNLQPKLCNNQDNEDIYFCVVINIHLYHTIMKTKLLISFTAAFLLLMPNVSFGQSINLGTAAGFVLFSTNGSVSNTGLSNLTGHVGTNSGSSTAFGNVNGVMHDQDGTSGQSATDLLTAYNQLDSKVKTNDHAALLGNGETLHAGVHFIAEPSTLELGLTLDAQNDPNAEFIFQIEGTFSTGTNSKIHLINGAKACNVYWKVEGLVSMASGTFMRGNVIANNAAIVMNANDTIEGRLLSTTGAITVNKILAYTPVGCSALLTGPAAPNLKSTACFSIFSGNGTIANAGISNVLGDVGTNVGLTTGFDAQKVSGAIHGNPDNNTANCAADLLTVYSYLNVLPADIELLYPALFGNDLVLTPHTYLLNSATVLTDTLYLNAQGNANAVFVIKIKGAFSTNTKSRVHLTNGALAKNVYWLVDGPVDINANSIFRGTIVCNNGAIDLKSDVTLDGRALTTNGALTTAAITTTMAPDCTNVGTGSIDVKSTNNAATIAPNPFSSSTTIILNDTPQIKVCEIRIYNSLGKEVLNTSLKEQITTINTSDLSSGIYFYKVVENDKTIQSGKLISQQ